MSLTGAFFDSFVRNPSFLRSSQKQEKTHNNNGLKGCEVRFLVRFFNAKATKSHKSKGLAHILPQRPVFKDARFAEVGKPANSVYPKRPHRNKARISQGAACCNRNIPAIMSQGRKRFFQHKVFFACQSLAKCYMIKPIYSRIIMEIYANMRFLTPCKPGSRLAVSRIFGLLLLPSLALLLLAGCAHNPRQALKPGLEQALQPQLGALSQNLAIGQELVLEGTSVRADADKRTQNSTEDSSARVTSWLAQPMSAELASAIALANNLRVSAIFAQLGIAHADFLNTVLPPNPELGLARRTFAGTTPNDRSLSIGINLLQLLTLPANAKAGAALQQMARAQATAEVLALANSAQRAWIDYAAALQSAELMNQALETAQASALTAEKLYEAGNIAKVDRDREALFAAELGAATLAVRASVVPAREGLVRTLGLSTQQAALLRDDARLRPPPTQALDIPDLAERVASASTDLAIAAGALQAARAQERISFLTALLPNLAFSFERERDDGVRKQGLGLSWMLPLFDLGQADRIRRKQGLIAATAHAKALDLEIRSHARERLAQAEAARQIAVQHRQVILPLSAEVFDGALLDFNAMHSGVFELLRDKQARLQAGAGSAGFAALRRRSWYPLKPAKQRNARWGTKCCPPRIRAYFLI
jgi:outer membrane protein, heavy metal efflux system